MSPFFIGEWSTAVRHSRGGDLRVLRGVAIHAHAGYNPADSAGNGCWSWINHLARSAAGNMHTVLYKIGGSLLTLPELGRRLARVLEDRPDSRTLFVVGGGRAADVVREWDRVHRLGEETAHRLAVRSLTLNEALLEQLLPAAVVVGDRQSAAQAWESNRRPILCVSEFLAAEEARTERALPHTWDATSDSIAGWVSFRWPADELVLIKSTPRPDDGDLSSMHDRGLVDRHFPTLGAKLPPLAWVNLRAEEPRIEPWP